MIERYFVYDKMMMQNYFEETLTNEAKILSTIPAFINARMFIRDNTPICVKPKNLWQSSKFTYGVIHEVEITRFGIELLDRVQSCSLSTMGFNYKKDLMHRSKVVAKAINIKDFASFSKYEYETVGECNVWVYLGNLTNPYVKEAAYNRQNKRGSVWRDFFNITIK